MAEIVICYARDGEATAGRLAGALRAEGLRIWSEEGSSGPITDRIDQVRAAIVVWSSDSRGSDWTRAEANYARGQKKLVQTCIDDAPPPMPFDAKAVISLADWSGEPDHPGWLKIRSAVAAVARPPRQAAASAPAAARQRPAKQERRRAVPPLALVLIAFAAAFGAFLWMRSGPPFGRAPAPIALTKAVEAPAIPELPPLPPPPSGLPDGNETMPAPIATPGEPARKSGSADNRPSSRSIETRPRPRPNGPRLNRRNSETMRLFCERSGRGTPQCRTFQRQLRNQQR